MYEPQANAAHASSDFGIVAMQMKQIMFMQKNTTFLAYTKKCHSACIYKKYTFACVYKKVNFGGVYTKKVNSHNLTR